MTKIIEDYSFSNEQQMTDIELSFYFEHVSSGCCSSILSHEINNKEFFLEIEGILVLRAKDCRDEYVGNEILSFLKKNHLSLSDLVDWFTENKQNSILDQYITITSPCLFWGNENGKEVDTDEGSFLSNIANDKIKAISLIDPSYRTKEKIKHF